MDGLAHTLWGYTLNKKISKRASFKEALLWSNIPDIIGLHPLLLWRLFTEGKFLEKNMSDFPSWFVDGYAFGHSLLPFLIVFVIAFFINKRKFYLPMLAWLLHIVCDLFLHPLEMNPIKLFYPLSNMVFPHHISYIRSVWPVVLNYIILISVYMIAFKKNKKEKKLKLETG